MKTGSNRFAWKIFSKIAIVQLSLILIALLGSGVAIRIFMREYDGSSASAQVLNHEFYLYFVFAMSILGALAIWSGWTLSLSIGRLLGKAESVLDSSKHDENEVFEKPHYGEFSDIETSLERIRRDLEAKTESLKIEREELSTLMAAISDAILAVDPEGVPLFYNSRFALVFGDEEGLRRRTARLWEMFREPDILDAFRAALKKGHSNTVRAIPLEHGGARSFYSLSVAPLRRQNGEIYGAVGIFHDVTELKAAEQIRIDFVANVSHELRTPLTSIKGYTDTLIQDVNSGREVEPEFLDIIEKNVNRLMSLIGDLLDLSALESTDVLQKAAVPTAEITQRVLGHLQGSLEARGHIVETRVSAPIVEADPKRLEQILVNLLDNANKYTPTGGKIELSWEHDRSAVVLKVKDNGPGIPVEHHPRLFERFYRVDKARSREQGGTGLGLAIVKHIMQRHGGTAWVESRMGHGSTFGCRFPA